MSNDDVVQFIAKDFVPVALNLYMIRAAKTPAGDFLQAVYKQKPQYQGLWVVAPDGKAPASHQALKSHKTWPQAAGVLGPTVLDSIRLSAGELTDLTPARAEARWRGCGF